MAVNDRDQTLGGFKAVDVHPGVANPTAHASSGNPMAANFVRGLYNISLTSIYTLSTNRWTTP